MTLAAPTTSLSTYFEELALALIDLQKIQSNQLDLLLQYIKHMKNSQGVVFICGNGGSFANALHWGVDLMKACGIKTHVLGSNPSALTAYSNDSSYDEALGQELRRLLTKDDMLVILTVSGRSRNTLIAGGICFGMGCPCFMISGEDAPTYMENVPITIPSKDYGVVEDCHAAICHWLVKQLQKGS